MAAKSKADDGKAPGPGHNGMSLEDEQKLLLHHVTGLRKVEAEWKKAKEAADAVRAVMTDKFRLAKAEGGWKRNELQEIMDAMGSLKRDLTADEERRARLRQHVGLPVGSQLDLFAKTPMEKIDEQAWEGEGYAVGLRGDEGKAPDDCPARFIQAFMRGYHAGQEKLLWAMADAGRVVDRDTSKDGEVRTVVLDPGEEDDGSPEALKAAAAAGGAQPPETTEPAEDEGHTAAQDADAATEAEPTAEEIKAAAMSGPKPTVEAVFGDKPKARSGPRNLAH